MSLQDIDQHILELKDQLTKTIRYLSHSYQKVQSLSSDPAKLDIEEFETWEAFSSRFQELLIFFFQSF